MKTLALSPILLVAAACAASPGEALDAPGPADRPVTTPSETPADEVEPESRPETMLDLLRWYDEVEGGNFAFTTETKELLESIELTTIRDGDIEVIKVAVRGT